MKKTALTLLTLLPMLGATEACNHRCASYCIYYYPSDQCVQTCGCPQYVLNESLRLRHVKEMEYIAQMTQL